MTKLRTEHSVLVSLNKCQENRRQQSLGTTSKLPVTGT